MTTNYLMNALELDILSKEELQEHCKLSQLYL